MKRNIFWIWILFLMIFGSLFFTLIGIIFIDSTFIGNIDKNMLLIYFILLLGLNTIYSIYKSIKIFRS